MELMRKKRIAEDKTLRDVAVLTYKGEKAITYTGGVIGIGSQGVYALADEYQIFVIDLTAGDYDTYTAAKLVKLDYTTLAGTVYVVLNDSDEAEAVYFFTDAPAATSESA